jgi:iron-sulfur cluster assembly accessory protein
MTSIEQDTISLQPAAPQPMLLISEDASSRLLAMIREKELDGYALRVFVAGGGCSGLQYGMTFDNELHENDHEFYAGDLRVLVDPMSAQYVFGASIDYVDSLMGGGFKIDNPNAVASCGCGHSFRTNEGEDAAANAGGGCNSCGV